MDMSRVVTIGCLMAMGMLVLASVGVNGEDVDHYEIGDRWVFDMSMDLSMDTGLVTMDGILTYRVDAISTESVAGVVYDVYEIGHDADLAVSGESEGFTIEGTATITGKDSYEMNTLDVVRSEQNLSMDLEFDYIISVSLEAWEYDVKTYSPPEGIGEEPDEMTEGTTWTITYTVDWESMSYMSLIGEDITTDSGSLTKVRTFTYIKKETVTVPAGSFECEVIQMDDGDSIETRWFSDEVGLYVKSVYESDSEDSGELELKSYSYAAGGSDGISSTLLLILGVVVVAIVAVAVVVVLMLRKKPGAPQMVPGQPPIPSAPVEQAPPVQPPPAEPPPGAPPQ